MIILIRARTIVIIAWLLTASGVYGRDLLIGSIASISNPLVAEGSKSITQGYQLAFDRVNGAGGINSNQLKLLVKDDKFEADEGVRLAKEMIEKDGIVALAGCVGTPLINALTSSKTLTENKIAYLGPLSGSSAAMKSPNVFAIRASYESELERIFRQMGTMYQTQVLFYYFKAGIGPVMSRAAVEMADKYKIKLLSNAGFDVSTDAAMQKTLIMNAVAPFSNNRPSSIVVIAAGGAMWLAIKHVREVYGPMLPIYLISVASPDDVIKNVGVKDAQGVIVSQAMPSPQDLNRKIVAEYLRDIKRYGRGEKPSYISLEGYVGGRILAEAIKSAGANPSRESTLRALYNFGDQSFGDVRINYSETERRGNGVVDLVVIGKNGTLIR